MTDINTTVLHARLTADVTVKEIGGQSLTTLRMAFSHDVKSGDNWEEKANFIDGEMWGNRGKALAKYLVKGSSIMVQGQLRQDRWTAEDGTKRSKHKLMIKDIQIARSKVDGATSQPELAEVGPEGPAK